MARKVTGQPVPQGALVFSSPLKFSAKPETETGVRQFDAVAYSGGVIENHWWWDRVVFDLSTTKSPQNIPALLNHDRRQIVGFAQKVDIGNEITMSGNILMSSDAGKQVAEFADAEFPWQMSVHIEPKDILEIPEGFSKVVNGHNVDGPCFVFQNSTIVEASFTPTGFDPNTSAHVFNRDGTPSAAITFSQLESTTMTQEEKDRLAALEAELAASKTALAAAAEREAAAKFESRKTRLKTAFAKVGMEMTDEDCEVYRGMDDDKFEVVAKKFESAKPVAAPKGDAHLFQQTFTGQGAAPNAAGSFDDNPVVKFSKQIADGLKKSKPATGDAQF